MMSAPLIEIERTPNPEAVRILPGIPLATGSTIELHAGDDTASLPIAAALFRVEGVGSLLIGRDFVTVVRASPQIQWGSQKPRLLLSVAEFLFSGEAAVAPSRQEEKFDAFDDDEIAAHISDVMDRFVQPMLARDGGEATLVRFDARTGLAYVRMGGACGGCPSGKMTLEKSIEQTIKRYVPEVAGVVEVKGSERAETDPRVRFRN